MLFTHASCMRFSFVKRLERADSSIKWPCIDETGIYWCVTHSTKIYLAPRIILELFYWIFSISVFVYAKPNQCLLLPAWRMVFKLNALERRKGEKLWKSPAAHPSTSSGSDAGATISSAERETEMRKISLHKYTNFSITYLMFYSHEIVIDGMKDSRK